MKKKLLSLFALTSLFVGTSVGQTTYLSEDFDAITPGTTPVGWTVVSPNSLPETWQVVTDRFGSDLDGTPFLLTDSDQAGSVQMDDTIFFDVTGTTGAVSVWLEFDEYFNDGFGGSGEVIVFDGTQWVSVDSRGSAEIGAWGAPANTALDITAYNNPNLQIGFVYSGNYSWYWAIDNVVVREILCQDVNNVTLNTILNDTLVFNIDDPSSTGLYNIEFGPQGFTPGAGQEQGSFSTTSTQDSVLNFPLGTNWQLYVQSDCGGGNEGAWVGPLDFYAPFCDPITGLQQDYLNEDTLVFSFTGNPSALDYTVEWGAAGFNPGMGEEDGSFSTTNLQDTIFGWSNGQVYEMYVQSNCTPGSGPEWIGPINWYYVEDLGFLVSDATCTTPFEDISATGQAINLADEAEVGITLPFFFQFETLLSNEVTMSDNGGLVFGTLTGDISFTLAGSPMASAPANAIVPYLDDFDADDVYVEVRGTAPNRRAIFQWEDRKIWQAATNPDGATFQAILYEGSNEIRFVYDDVVMSGTHSNGEEATVGVNSPDTTIQISEGGDANIMDGMCILFQYVDCPPIVDVTVTYVGVDTIIFDFTPFGSSASQWTVEYGPAGFTPGSGTSFTTSTTTDTIPGLMQFTEYDFYITSDCGGSTSDAFGPTTVTTEPVCPAPTGFQLDNIVSDSAFFSWTNGGTEMMWVVEYGPVGFTPGTGTTANFDTNPDTLLGLPDGMVYDFIIYADCGGATNNPFDGPITVATPVVNDSTCDAVTLMYDSTYVYSNINATIHPGETKGNASPAFATVWFEFVSPASGKVEIDLTGSDFDTYTTVYSTTDCGDWAQFTVEDFSDPSTMSLCGLSPSTVYYIQVDGFGGSDQGIINIRLTDLDIDAGTAQATEICAGATLNLNSTISGGEMNGTWTELNPMLGLVSGSNYNSSAFQAAGTYEVEYRVTNVCGYDSVIVPIDVLRAPSAGMDGTIAQECNFGTVVLTNGLSGTVDLGGTWYDSTGVALTGNSIDFNGEAAGQYDYIYVASNGVCPDDTAMVTVDLIDCTSLSENDLDNFVTIYPNPTSGTVFINNHGIEDDFTIEVMDINGKVLNIIQTDMNKGEVFELNMNTSVKGVYFIRIKTSTGIGQHKVVVQ